MAQQTGNNSPLGDKFKDFEFTPSNNLFDGIKDELTHDPEVGNLSGKLSHYTHDVSENVWKEIDKELHPKKKRPLIIWWVAAACVTALAIINIMNIQDDTKEMSTISVQENKKILNPTKENSNRKYFDVTPQVEFEEKKFEKATNIKTKNISKLESKIDLITIPELDLKPIRQKIKLEKILAIKIKNKQDSLQLSLVEGVNKDISTVLKTELLEDIHQKKRNVNSAKHSLSSVTGSLLYASLGMQSEDEFYLADNSTNSFTAVATENLLSDQKRYTAPVSMGILYQRSLNQRLSISTGVMYTRINYEYYIRNGTERYLSVPVNMTLNLLKKSKFNFFPIIGTQVDFGLNGKDKIESNQFGSNIDLNQTNPGTQIASLLGAGLSYNITPKISLFGQSLFQYHVFSSYYSYYNQVPIAISYQGGIKFSF